MTNAGKYNRKIKIYRRSAETNERGFSVRPIPSGSPVLTPYAEVKTTKGMTIIKNDSDFEKAYTRFVIRYPRTEISRDMLIEFKGKIYTIEYLNNVDEKSVELEIQAKEVTH